MQETSYATESRRDGTARAGDQGLVYIVEDDRSLSAALDNLLRSVGYETRCHGSVAAFIAETRSAVPSCLLLDVRLPGISGLEIQVSLPAPLSDLPVIMMSGFGDIPMTVRAMKAGAIDFLPKPFRDQDLLDAVTQALAVDRERQGTRRVADVLERKLATLKPRERQVLKLVAVGKTNKVIADTLCLSEITVKIHRASMMRKLDVATIADLVRVVEQAEKYRIRH